VVCPCACHLLGVCLAPFLPVAEKEREARAYETPLRERALWAGCSMERAYCSKDMDLHQHAVYGGISVVYLGKELMSV